MNHRYLTLDAFRGVAAIIVVTVHIQSVWPEGKTFPSGYLAVDFFFALSGFVLAHAYEERLGRGLNALRFMKMRIIRLYPLFLLGCLIMLLPKAVRFSGGHIGLDVPWRYLPNLLMLPAPMTHRYYLYPLNFPAWSLAFEIVANAAFAIFAAPLRKLSVLSVLLMASWVALVLSADGVKGLDHGVMNSDWWLGLPRVFFSFFLGVFLYRHRSTNGFRIPPWTVLPLAFVFVGTFAIPGGMIYDLAVVTVVYPLIIIVGAQIVSPVPRLASFLGDASYAVYVLHLPVWSLLEGLLEPFRTAYELPVELAFVCLILALACLADIAFDKPVRRWMNRHLLKTARTPIVAASTA